MRLSGIYIMIIALVLMPSAAFAQVQKFTDTVYPLQINADKKLFVQIKADYPVSTHQIKTIKDAILSEDSFAMGGKKFFKGWAGAIKEASNKPTSLNLPTDLVFTNSTQNDAKVIIILTESINDEGYSGLTKFTINTNRLWSSEIIIYQAENLSDVNLSSIIKHEFGHALGLGHSSDFDDLMYAGVDPKFSFISQGDVQALHALYDGKILSRYYIETS